MKRIKNVNRDDMLRLCGNISNIAESEYDEIILSSLTEREYEMIRLRYDESMTYQSIADMFGISTTRARQIISYAECRKIPAGFRKAVHAKEYEAWLKEHANDTHTMGEWRLLRHQTELAPLNARAIHALVKNAGVDTVNDVVDLVSTDQFVGGHIKGIARNGVTYKLILEFVDKIKDQKDMPI
jgi:hypothetical protein